MQTILGANGIIAVELTKELKAKYTPDIRLVSRNPKKVNETDSLFSADLLDAKQTSEAVKGSAIIYMTVGLPYRSDVWQRDWPIIMQNVINACETHKAKLVYFDNTYMYGQTNQLITEEEPFASQGKKGLVRGKIAKMVLDAIADGSLEATICRAPEFYGPGITKSITNAIIFDNIAKGKRPKVLLRDDTLRTLIYTPDAGKATALIGNTPDTSGQTWHLPCDDNRLTQKQFIAQIEVELGNQRKPQIISKGIMKLASLFNQDLKETRELLPRYEMNNLFDSSKFKKRFPTFKVTSYEEGIRSILDEMKKP